MKRPETVQERAVRLLNQFHAEQLIVNNQVVGIPTVSQYGTLRDLAIQIATIKMVLNSAA